MSVELIPSLANLSLGSAFDEKKQGYSLKEPMSNLGSLSTCNRQVFRRTTSDALNYALDIDLTDESRMNSSSQTLPVIDAGLSHELNCVLLGSLSGDQVADISASFGISAEPKFKTTGNNLTSKDPKKQPRAQGYRKLWQQITKVRPGQFLGEDLGMPVSDMTVEDLVKVTMKLAPHESAVNAIMEGLYYLDSSALAALLKELAKQGHLKRSVEIFDWLRSLEPSHDLAGLCDVYTYTTMISQCGSHQQLRRALELAAEMRTRGVECNVHTYSALMNVCVKANELELAEDIYRQMSDEGCVPNLVTYNILIDVYVKKGHWEDAVALLDKLQRQGITAEVRTYNTVISACNKSGQPDAALAVYEKMLGAGVKPSATTYTALISAYGKKGQVEAAIEVFNDMTKRGCERNVITYSSLISACEKAGRWELAIALFERMHHEDCKPNVVTYNSLIAACVHGGQHQKASQFFHQMQVEGCKPDSITYTALIAALQVGGQWQAALQAFEQMQSQGCSPDAVVFNNVLDVLWQSGVLLAQAKAMQLWMSANRSGHFRIYCNTKQDDGMLRYSSNALTCGTAMITLLRWLTELRSKVNKDGQGSLRDRIQLALHKTKHNRTEQPSKLIRDTLASALMGSSSPFTINLLEHTVILEAPSQELCNWLRSAPFQGLVSITGLMHQTRQLPTELLLHEDLLLNSRCGEAYAAVLSYESTAIHPTGYSTLAPALLQQRPQMVHLAVKYCTAFYFKQDVVFDALHLLDRTLTSTYQIPTNLWPALLCCCILIAAHQTEPETNWPTFETVAAVTGFGQEVLSNIERNMCVWLQNDFRIISPLRVVHLYLERLGHYLAGLEDAPNPIANDVCPLLLKFACNASSIGLLPTAVAAASLFILRKAKGIVPLWPSSLLELTSLPAQTVSDISTCLLAMPAT